MTRDELKAMLTDPEFKRRQPTRIERHRLFGPTPRKKRKPTESKKPNDTP
jgi:hypothetical protein